MSLVSLIYASSATRLLETAELLELLEISRRNNHRVGVTGVLLYKDGNFMQVLEGEPGAVRQVFDRISRDPRHSGILVLRHAEHAQRDFPEWSMAFHDLNSPEARAVPGYSEFLNNPITAAAFSDNPTLCQKLLLAFKRTIAPDHGR